MCHVTKFETIVQKCSGPEIAMNDEVFTVIFLQSLGATFSTFVTVTLLGTSEVKIQCSQVMASAVEHAKTQGGDEANHSGAALDSTGMCRNGAACRKWVAGTCNKNHPAPGNKAKNSGGEEKQGEWTCSCGMYNFANRSTCFAKECNNSRPNGGKRKRVTFGNNKEHAKVVNERSKLSKKVAKMAKQMKDAKAAVKEAGVDVDIGFTAAERSGGGDVIDMDLSDDSELAMGSHENAIRFKCDSGATSHFANFELPVSDVRNYKGIVDIADGSQIRVTKRAKFEGVTDGGDEMDLTVKLADDFDQNLFSIKKACEAGQRAVFDSEGSYLQDKATGDKVPMESTTAGWDLWFRPKGRSRGT